MRGRANSQKAAHQHAHCPQDTACRGCCACVSSLTLQNASLRQKIQLQTKEKADLEALLGSQAKKLA